MATLLAAAKLTGGLCIHSGKLYRNGSYMDEEAQLDVFAENLANGPLWRWRSIKRGSLRTSIGIKH